ncbi:response regulator [Gallibacterium anatis]|uniref:Nitrate/nitrite response regulator n=4 Tax=Gallibacterium anatis TaxID=750 RepID=A0A0A3ALA5_9PAST|nr:response regulator [Gallibacterium anatis]AEC18222.1 transcriptional regulator NarP [Gallibacterium anatis UMN179]ERF78318.1 transcriptional regulator [Gallibacterium anatis 12656/12]KGQ27359.1 nitrate/nitrite response regulator [Gallibacterium anatis]KGQ27439.1 nitrate/nitrite response regulator [Gallibacterium anatis]KGQ27916.1 nitrate/nitrite response regulator [Gallibacterium anatis CCM5995]
MKKTTILVIDDHPLMRRGITQLLQLDDSFEVLAEASNGTEGLALAKQFSPDMIILDLNMKGMSGLDVLKALRLDDIDARIAVLTVSDARSDIFALIEAGADGYLLKDTEPDTLLVQLKKIAEGQVVLSDAVKQRLLDNHSANDPLQLLTDREMDVLKLIATGLSNKQIANQLFISEETVKVHIRNLLRKLNVHSRVAATVLYLEHRHLD